MDTDSQPGPPSPAEIAAARSALGLSRPQCAARLGISAASLATYERALSVPKATIVRLALWQLIAEARATAGDSTAATVR